MINHNTVIAKYEEEMVTEESNTLGLEINLGKIKLMVIDRSKLQLNNMLPNIVNHILETFHNRYGKMRSRITLSLTDMRNQEKIWTDKEVIKYTEMAFVFSYGSEWRTIKAADSHQIEAFEM